MSKQLFFNQRELELMEEINNGSINARHDIPEEGERSFDCPDATEKQLLLSLLHNSVFTGHHRDEIENTIKMLDNYEGYNRLLFVLEDSQVPYDQLMNPNATDAKNHVKKIMRG